MNPFSRSTRRGLFHLTLAIAAAFTGGEPGLGAQAPRNRPVAAQASGEPVRFSDIAPERAEVNLVLIDLLVRDRQGRPVRGLTPEDFDLLIDRLPAPIASFEANCPEASVDAEAPGQAEMPSGSGGAGEPQAPAATGPAQEPRHQVLFFDLNHLTRAGRDRSIDAALKFVRTTMSPADRVMLIAMKGRPILLESFTSDRARLDARLTAMRADDSMLDLTVLEERANLGDVLARDCAEGGGLCQSRLNVALPYALAEENRARRSLNVLRSLMPALAPLKGRKSVIHFSETLKDEPGAQYLLLAGSTPQRERIDMKDIIQDLHREANAAGVSLYPVFAAGLGDRDASGFVDASVSSGSGDTVLTQRARTASEDGALALHTTMALETGGTALKRSNDLSRVFTTVENDLGCYYVLGYTNPGPGDGKRHGILVKAKQKGYEVRHRPYFEDWSETERLDRRFRSALLAPAYFREIEATAEVFALAPGEKTTPVLIKMEFPLDEITFVGRPDGSRAGEAEVRGSVWTGSKEVCRFERRFPLTLGADESAAERKVIYEAGCELPPGQHDLTVAVLDAGSWEIGGAERALPVKARAPGIAGDVVLWTSSGSDILVAADAAGIGIKSEGSGHGFAPKGERRFGAREAGVLFVVVCPEEKGVRSEKAAVGGDAGGGANGEAGGSGESGGARSVSSAGAAVEIRRVVYSGDNEVASFPVVRLGEISAAATGPGVSARNAAPGSCEGIYASFPPGRLAPGRYTFEVQLTGIGPSPIVRRAGFAVDPAPPAATTATP